MRCEWLLLIACFLCPDILTGGVTQLQTLIDGVSSPNVASFPVGVNVTYICTVEAAAHSWSIPALSITDSITLLDPPAVVQPPFTIRPMPQSGNRLTSSLSFTTYIGLNGTAVSCTTSLVPNAEAQETTIIVIGEISGLMAIVNGAVRNTSNFCVNENVTLMCDFIAVGHTWDIPSHGISNTITPSDSVAQHPPFTIKPLLRESSTILRTSSLSFVVSAELNGTIISCMNNAINNTQRTTVTVLGLPSAPSLQSITGDFQEEVIHFTIVPPSYGALCVQHYTISSETSSGGISPVGPFNAPGPSNTSGGLVTFTKGGFDLCRVSYKFRVTAITSAGSGAVSSLYSQGPVSFRSPVVNITNTGFQIFISWVAPTSREYNVSIRHSSFDNPVCVENMTNLTVTGQQTTTTEEPLDCNYAGQRVSFCIQFGYQQCRSNTSIVSTRELPDLTTVQQVEPSQRSALTLLVSANHMQDLVIRCSTEEYQVYVIVEENGEVIASRRFPFFNSTLLDFDSIPEGDYNCTTSVIMNDNTTVESKMIACSSRGPPDTLTTRTVTIVIASSLSGLSLLLLLIVIVVIGAFAKVYWTKRTRRLAIQRNRQPIPGSPVYEELTSLSYRHRTDNILLETNQAYGQTVGFR